MPIFLLEILGDYSSFLIYFVLSNSIDLKAGMHIYSRAAAKGKRVQVHTGHLIHMVI